jgi:hypothetical protein
MYLLPDDARSREDDALRQAIATLYRYVGVGHIEQLDDDFIRWAAIIGVDDADAVRDDEAAFEWRAASGKDGKEMPARHLDDEPCANERDRSGSYCEVVRGGKVEAGRFLRAIRGE